MTNMMFELAKVQLNTDEIALLWLGQAGFIVRDHFGTVVVVDPYLSDCGETLKGFVRKSPKLMAAEDLKPDIYITTHQHFDHFDFDTIPIVADCSEAKFYGPASCCHNFLKMGICSERVEMLEVNQELQFKGVKITAAFADHGDLAPDAIGILMEIGGVKLYFSGDTAYRPEKMMSIQDFHPDLAFLSINGAFGNLNALEGAYIVRDLSLKAAIPCHFGTFIEHGGDPQAFEFHVSALAPFCQVIQLRPGEMYIYKK